MFWIAVRWLTLWFVFLLLFRGLQYLVAGPWIYGANPTGAFVSISAFSLVGAFFGMLEEYDRRYK